LFVYVAKGSISFDHKQIYLTRALSLFF